MLKLCSKFILHTTQKIFLEGSLRREIEMHLSRVANFFRAFVTLLKDYRAKKKFPELCNHIIVILEVLHILN